MIHTLLNVIYVLIAIAMVVLILLQRGAGAQAGSGFGAGASGTVFGARGSANFLSSSTKWLAAAFFSLSLFMAWQASHDARQSTPDQPDLGVMANLPSATPAEKAPATALPSAPAQPGSQPAAPEATPVIAPAAPAEAPAADKAAAEGGKGG